MKETLKILVLTVCFSTAIFSGVHAQKDKSKSVSTRFLKLPAYDITEISPSAIQAEFVSGPYSFGPESLSETKTLCVPSGGKLKDAIEVTTYFYAVPVVQPASYLVARQGGQVIYAERLGNGAPGTVQYGFDQCANWIADRLKKEWDKEKNVFLENSARSLEEEQYAYASALADQNLFLRYVADEIEVFYAKDKDYDYSELEVAFEKATAAYELIDKEGYGNNPRALLEEALLIWEKELADCDTENNKARINKQIAKGLHENAANAYLYLYRLDEALSHARKAAGLWGNFSNNRSAAWDERIGFMQAMQLAASANENILTNPEQLIALAGKADEGSVKVSHLDASSFASLENDYQKFIQSTGSKIHQEQESAYNESVASGEVNPYEKYVTETSIQGKIIMLSPLMMAPELTALPVEICDISDLQQIIITNNKIASIPGEIGKLEALSVLNLSNNELRTLPPEIGSLKNLKKLNLSNNPLEEIPAEIAGCQSLERLILKGCGLSAEQLAELEELLPNVKIKS